MTRRDLLWSTLLAARPAEAQAPVPSRRYRIPPPYATYYPLIESGSDAFGDAGRMDLPVIRRLKAMPKWFAEVTGSVLDSEQLRHGIPYWAARLDPATGIDIYGNNGIAAADIDGDGRDEVHVCQPAGLPNRLFRWREGRLIDISAAAGLDLLDDTASALFLDLRNLGRQDAILLRGGGPLLYLNDGKGQFTLAPGAFRFARPPAGSFTGMAAADYDRDGRLDVYLCCYSFFQSEAQYRYPSPYHDAQNGPPNFLFRNRLNADGSGFLEDVTEAAGLNQNNNRFSFAPAWCDYDGSGWPSLYVANDFGRNNLYRNREGRFTDVAAEAGVEDLGPGMSACWFDEDGDGRPDLYIANMSTEVGQRVVNAEAFPHRGTPELRDAYRRHTKGNSFYRNRGEGRFEERGADLGIERGQWAWSADACDFDNDGVNEIYITCGMLTGGRQPDLMSFFWRQVVAASPADSTRSAAYENGWNAINQFIREGYSWSGNQANIFYKKLGGRYADASLQSGLDIAGDARAFAFVDLDDDGCVDLLLKCRLGPQLRVFQNRVGQEQRRIAFQLEGVKSNRDAIGARVEVNGRVRWLNAGSGYLSQHSKTVFIGLGNDERIERASILWPSGLRQPLEGLQMDSLYRVREGDSPVLVRGFAKSGFAKSGSAKSLSLPERTVAGENQQRLHDTWFVEPIPLPEPQRGPGLYVVDGAAASPAFALFRRYLFEYRADLEPRLALLLDARGHAVKVYAQVPDAARVAADLRTTPRPLPYPGRSLNPMRRDFFKLGAALLGCGYREEALPYLEEVLRRDPANHTARVLAAQVHREAGRWDQARSSLRLVLDAAPQIAEAWNELGGVEQGQYADHKKALECFEQAVAWKPDLVYALLNAAQSAARLQDLAKARDLYERALAASPRNAAAHNGLGLLLAQSGESAKAEVHFRDAVKHDAALGGAWNNLAVLLLRQRREPEALQVLREGIRQAPGEELLYLNLGRILLQQGDRQGARAVMEQLLKTNPGSAVARKALEDLRNPER